MHDLFEEQLKVLRAASLNRRLSEIGIAQGPEIEIAARSSNDYLGLANDSRLRKAAIAAINEFGVGAGASRLISCPLWRVIRGRLTSARRRRPTFAKNAAIYRAVALSDSTDYSRLRVKLRRAGTPFAAQVCSLQPGRSLSGSDGL